MKRSTCSVFPSHSEAIAGISSALCQPPLHGALPASRSQAFLVPLGLSPSTAISQRLAPQFRYQHGATQVAKRVLRKGPPEWQEEYSDWQFPPKPPWMRWKTYNLFDERARAYEKAADDVFLWRCRRFLLPDETIDGLVDRICGDC
jgi:hypothetical protein